MNIALKKYKDLGLKLTPQRLAILNYLDGNVNHPSADEIYKAISKAFPTMSFATVYNTLETLRKIGSITELSVDSHRKRFDPNTELHHHLMCIKCGRILDIKIAFEIALPDGQGSDYEITGNHVEFYGKCPECKSAGNRQ